jgi:LacI family transcriptional regulator
VSYVLNNGPRPVAPETRARVEDAIAKLGYRPNAIASALRGGTTRSIGLLLPDPRNPYYAELAQAIEQQFSERGYLVLTGSTYYSRILEEQYRESFIARKVDGLIVSSGVSLAHEQALGLGEQPVLVLDDAPESVNVSSIAPQNHDDAAAAVEHLQRHGHRMIGCIGGLAYLSTESAHIAGWRNQQIAAGAPAGDELVSFADPSEAGGNAAAQLLLSDHGRPWALHGHRPSALFVSSDVQAVGAIFACYELGLRVPEDIAIVSMGGTKTAAFTIPPLTSMRQDIQFIARLAASHLLDRVVDASANTLRRRLRGNLVIGHSCGC